MPMRFLALAAGLLYPLAFAPHHWWPLVLVSIALAWRCLRDAGWREALLRGWLFGLGLFGHGVFWVHVSMHEYGYTPLWLAIPMTLAFAAFLALFPALLFALTARLAAPAPGALFFAGAWVLLDLVRARLMTGFPWLYPGNAMLDTPLAALAPLGGVWLVTLATVLTAVALGQLGRNWRPAVPAAVMALVGWGLAAGEPFYSDVEPAGDPVPVALVQGNIPQDLRWQTTMRERTREIYAELTTEIPENHLVLWPESAITEFYQDVENYLAHQGVAVASRGGAMITGIPWRDRSTFPPTYHNSVAVISGGRGVYHKQRLVPFGEYVPLEGLLRGIIPFFDLPMSSFTPGHPRQPNLEVMGHIMAPFICYEIVYPEFVRTRSADSNVIMTISNDAWFGTSAGPHQHFEIARMRARETGRWLVRGTNNGITAVVNPRGEVHDRLPQFERDVLYSEYVPVTGKTHYMRWSGLPVWLLSALLVGIGGWHYRRHHRATQAR